MPGNFSYLSILNPGFSTVTSSTPPQAGAFGYVSFLNPPSTGGAGGGATVNGSTGDVSIVAGANITLSTAGSTITVIGGAGAGGGVGTNTAQTNVTWTVNTSGISINASAYLTTAMPAAEPHIQQVVYGTATKTSGTLVLSGSGGISVSQAGDTAIISFDGHHLDALVPSGNGYGTGFSSMTSGTVGLNAVGALSMSQNGNGLSLSVPSQTVQPAVGLNTAATSVTWTVNSSGISINAGAYLTTAAQVSHSHGNPTLALTNLTGTTASASNGFTLSLSAAAAGAGGGATVNGSTGNVSIVAGANITLNTAGSTISIVGPTPGGGAAPAAYFAQPVWNGHGGSNALLTNITGISRRVIFMPFENIGNLSFGELHWPMSRAATGVNAFSVFMGVYSFSNATRLDVVYTTSGAYSQTATASQSGLRGFEMTFASTSLTPGQYVLGLMFDPIGGSTSAMNYSLMGAATGNTVLLTQVVNGSDTYHVNVNHMHLPFHGRYSVTTAALPASVPSASILAQGNATNIPLPMYWMLGTDYT